MYKSSVLRCRLLVFGIYQLLHCNSCLEKLFCDFVDISVYWLSNGFLWVDSW